MDCFAKSLQLLIVLLISSLNVGLSSTFSSCEHLGQRGAGGALGGVVGGRGRSAWLTAYISPSPPEAGVGCSSMSRGDEDCLSFQRSRTDGHGKRHSSTHDLSIASIEDTLWSAERLRGGEIEPNRDVSGTPDTSAKDQGVTHDTKKTEEIVSSSFLWGQPVGSKGPRSFSSLNSGDDINAEVAMQAGTASRTGAASDVDGGAQTAKTKDLTTTEFVSECLLPTPRGSFRLRAYRHRGNGRFLEPVVMLAGDLTSFEGVPVRVHDQCLTSEVLGSLRCDCKQQLELALDYISEHGGCVIYMQQEGRGIGLANKVAAYALQDGGLDTVDANRHLGFDDDLRSYEAVEFILADMGIKSVKLMTNNPFKLKCLKAMGIKILSRIPMLVAPNAHSLAYLKAKAHRMSHFLHQLDDVEFMDDPSMDGACAPVALPLDEVGAIRGGENSAGSVSSKKEEKGDKEEGEEEYAFGRDSVLAAIEAVKEGKCVVVTDDEGRENEGDLIFAAEKATEDLLAFTIRHTSGVICASLEEDRLKELQMPQMVENNEDPKMTAFTVTVDAKRGVSTGISAGDRAITLRALSDSKATPEDFNRPGHIFPLRYTAGGVLKRGGHTEAAIDLAKLAGLSPVGVLCEITTKDGKGMARLPELRKFCSEHGLILTSIQDMRCLIRERQRESGGADSTPSFMLAR